MRLLRALFDTSTSSSTRPYLRLALKQLRPRGLWSMALSDMDRSNMFVPSCDIRNFVVQERIFVTISGTFSFLNDMSRLIIT